MSQYLLCWFPGPTSQSLFPLVIPPFAYHVPVTSSILYNVSQAMVVSKKVGSRDVSQDIQENLNLNVQRSTFTWVWRPDTRATVNNSPPKTSVPSLIQVGVTNRLCWLFLAWKIPNIFESGVYKVRTGNAYHCSHLLNYYLQT